MTEAYIRPEVKSYLFGWARIATGRWLIIIGDHAELKVESFHAEECPILGDTKGFKSSLKILFKSYDLKTEGNKTRITFNRT